MSQIVTWPNKDADEELWYQHDFGPGLSIEGGDPTDDLLPLDDPIADNRPTAVVAEGDVSVSAIRIVENTRKVQYLISGGTDGSAQKIELTVRTTGGEKHQVAAKFKIKDV